MVGLREALSHPTRSLVPSGGAVVALDLGAVAAGVAADPHLLAGAGGGLLAAVAAGVLVGPRLRLARDVDAGPLHLPRATLCLRHDLSPVGIVGSKHTGGKCVQRACRTRGSI